MPPIDIDKILSDPMLLIATVLLILGPVVFVFALVKFWLAGRKHELIPLDDAGFANSDISSVSQEATPAAKPPPYTVEETPPASSQPVSPPRNDAPEKTVVMPPGVGEIQGQMEIAFSQIKTLNKKVLQMESELESIARTANSKLEAHELKEAPSNPADFMHKLLKLAEHVIVLEKEVARLKTAVKNQPANGLSTAPTSPPPLAPVAEPAPHPIPKPPIMPI